MNTKLTIALVLGIILLGAGALFLIQRNEPENPTQNQAENGGPNIPEEPRRFIIGHTDIPGYKVTVLNELEIIDAIQDNNIFGRTYIYIGNQTTGERPLDNIGILLTEEVPEKEPEFGTSDYVFLVPGSILFHLVVSAEEMSNSELGNEVLRKIIDYSYRLVHKSATEEEIEAAVNSVYDSLLEKNESYIVIESQ